MGLSESPAADPNDTNTRSGGPSITRGIPVLVEHLSRSPVAQGLMGPLVVIEPEVDAQFPAGLCAVTVRHNPVKGGDNGLLKKSEELRNWTRMAACNKGVEDGHAGTFGPRPEELHSFSSSLRSGCGILLTLTIC